VNQFKGVLFHGAIKLPILNDQHPALNRTKEVLFLQEDRIRNPIEADQILTQDLRSKVRKNLNQQRASLKKIRMKDEERNKNKHTN
jgi:hypothetical protein